MYEIEAPLPTGRRANYPSASKVSYLFLTAALCFPSLAEANAAAPDSGGAALVEHRLPALLRERLPQADEQLAEALAEQLAKRAARGQRAAVFNAAMASPFDFGAPLSAFAVRVVPKDPALRQPLRRVLREWRTQFGENANCEVPALPPPVDLEQAVAQVRELASAAVNAQRDALSERARRALAKHHAALAVGLRDTIAAAMPRRERRRLRRFVARLEAGNMASALCAATIWAQLADRQWLEALRRLLAAHPKANAARIRDETTPWGEIVFAGRADGVLRSRKLLFLADLGGNDFHGIDGGAPFLGHPQFVVDFAGDDRYESTAPGGFGAGVGRTAIVVDFAGDDRYQSGGQGQGHALFGLGALLDWAGDDRYDARHHAQGSAWFGAGLLFDGGGNDRYRVEALGQGVGLPHGIGVLWDVGGDDGYTALGGAATNYGTPGLADAWAQGVARGLRGIAPGGVGLLADFAGDDRYDAGSFAQGGGYYRGVGQLLDYGGGRDALFGSRYNAGWGAHGGVGRFFNEAGDDRYATRHIVAAGAAWDYSLAVFHDAAGDDEYRLPGFSFGAAAHRSLGMFVDGGGNDRYEGAKPVHAETGAPNIAVFFDGESGQDVATGAWRGSAEAPSCSVRGEHALVLLGTDGNLPQCANGKAESANP